MKIKFLLLTLLIIFAFSGCSSDNTSAKDGLDLQALPKLVRESKSADELEAKLNQPNSINNLDLDDDGNADYINVTEYGAGDAKGFSLTVEVPNAGGTPEIQEVANIQLEKTPTNVNLAVTGNNEIYGAGNRYESSFGLDDFLMMAWLYNMSRPAFVSPYHYNSYPPSYTRYHTIERTVYVDRVSPTRTGTKVSGSQPSGLFKSNIVSPNDSKSASSIKAPLTNPTSSQRSFQVQSPSTRYKSGGFGQTRPSSASGSKPSGSSPTRYSSGGFGGSRPSGGKR